MWPVFPISRLGFARLPNGFVAHMQGAMDQAAGGGNSPFFIVARFSQKSSQTG
jgi:hypothetical protein